jgi:hypothetical protein
VEAVSEPTNDFRFSVRHPRDWDDNVTSEDWIVELPHQCDAWTIAGDNYDSVPHAEAVAELEKFIAEAQSALAALREGRELNALSD